MSAWESPIIRVSTGLLNTVNDSVIANQAGISGVSKFGGQLGKVLWVSDEQIAQMYSSTVGVLYAGAYQYVQLAADQTIVRGDLLYWDQGEAANSYVVTLAADTTSYNYQSYAGFALNTITAGNYGFIQIAGLATGLYVASITGTKARGRTVFASVATAGRIDIKDDLATTGGAHLANEFIGWAVDLPTDNTVGLIQIGRPISHRG